MAAGPPRRLGPQLPRTASHTFGALAAVGLFGIALPVARFSPPFGSGMKFMPQLLK